MARARKGTSPDPQVSSTADRRADPRIAWVVAAAALSALVIVAASFLPAHRLWGVNHLAFASPAARYAAIVVLALAFVPALARGVYRIALRASQAHAVASRPVGWVTAVVAAVAFAALCYQFRATTNLLGDGQLIAQSFEAAEEGHDSVIMRSAKAIVTEETIAPGTTLLYYAAVKTGAKLKQLPVPSMKVLNCILGGAFALLLLRAARAAALGAEARLWMVLLAAFSCSTFLFFGYIENYTAPYLFSALYVVTAFLALHKRAPLWLPIVPLVLASYAHVHSILLIPSYVLLAAWMRARKRRALLLRLWMPVFSVALVVAIVACSSIEALKKFFVPFGFSGNTLLSPRHLADMGNEIMMLLPIAPVVAAMGWLGRRAERSRGDDPARDKAALKDPTSLLSHPIEWQFASTILVACVMYLLFFKPEIGMARDWDLFTMSTVALVPLSVLALNRYVRAFVLTPEATARFAVPSLAVVVVLGAAWVGINASTDRTIDRLQRILAYDKSMAAYAWENLAILEHDRGKLDASIRTMEIAIDNGHNPRHYVRLAVYLEEAGRIDEAIPILEKVLARRPEFVKARYRLALFLEKKQDWAKMLEVAREGVRYHPEEAFYRFLYGESLLRAGRIDEGVEMFRSVRNMKLPAAAKQRVEQVLGFYDTRKK